MCFWLFSSRPRYLSLPCSVGKTSGFTRSDGVGLAMLRFSESPWRLAERRFLIVNFAGPAPVVASRKFDSDGQRRKHDRKGVCFTIDCGCGSFVLLGSGGARWWTVVKHTRLRSCFCLWETISVFFSRRTQREDTRGTEKKSPRVGGSRAFVLCLFHRVGPGGDDGF
jgi:hypothetical protein